MKDILFFLLRDEASLQRAQQTFRLLYCYCIPLLAETSIPHAIAGDKKETFLVVLRQAHPYDATPVEVTALVVDVPEGLDHLKTFLCHFLGTNQCASNVFLGGQHTIVHTGDKVSRDELLRTLQTITHRPAKTS